MLPGVVVLGVVGIAVGTVTCARDGVTPHFSARSEVSSMEMSPANPALDITACRTIYTKIINCISYSYYMREGWRRAGQQFVLRWLEGGESIRVVEQSWLLHCAVDLKLLTL